MRLNVQVGIQPGTVSTDSSGTRFTYDRKRLFRHTGECGVSAEKYRRTGYGFREFQRMGRTEKQLADQISKKLNLTIRTGREFVPLLLELVREDLENTGRSELRGLGTFAVHTRPGRDTIHPKTGEKVHIPTRKAIRYRASKELKTQINGGVPKDSDPPRPSEPKS